MLSIILWLVGPIGPITAIAPTDSNPSQIPKQAPQAAIGPSAGGTYTMTVDRGKPIALTSVGFSDPGVTPFGSPADTPSQVFLATSTGLDTLPALTRACLAGGHLGRVLVIYTNVQHHAEFTIELKRASVGSLTLPGVDRAGKALEDLSWALRAEEEHFDYQLMKAPAAGISDANKGRIERAHARIQALMWQQIKHQNWHAPATETATPPSRGFELAIESMPITGILSIGPLSLEQSSEHPRKGMDAFAPLTLVLDAARSTDLTAAAKAGKPLPAVTVTYYRPMAAGHEAEIRVVLKEVSVKLDERSESKPTMNLTLEYKDIEVKVSS